MLSENIQVFVCLLFILSFVGTKNSLNDELYSSCNLIQGKVFFVCCIINFTPCWFVQPALAYGHSLEYENKSPQLYWTLSNILANHGNVVVWLVSVRLPISNISSSIINPHLGLFVAYQLQLVSPSPLYSITFLVPWQALGTYLSFCFLWFSLGWQVIVSLFFFL